MNNIGGIFKRITTFQEMYDLIDYLAIENKKIYAGDPYQSVVNNMVIGIALVNREKCTKHFIKTHYVNNPGLIRIFWATEKAGYIQHHKLGIAIDTLCVTPYGGEKYLKRTACFCRGYSHVLC